MVRPPDFKWPTRVCVGCGEEFQPTGSVQKHCGPSCRPTRKTCYQCTREKDRDDFYKYPDGRLMVPCKDCRREYAKASWHARDTERVAREADARWERKLRRQFNIDPDDYWRMYDEQQGRCRICSRSLQEMAEGERRGSKFVFMHFAVDHDRRCCSGPTSCGKCVRGLLCTKCNGSLGWYEQFSDEIAAYLAATKR